MCKVYIVYLELLWVYYVRDFYHDEDSDMAQSSTKEVTTIVTEGSSLGWTSL